jgi:hypothetical protein
MKILFLLVVLLFFLFALKPRTPKIASGTGPGYIPAFQGHPGIGVSGV